MAGGSSVGQLQGSMKASFGQRALNYFKGTTQTFTNIAVAPGVFNKNLKMFMAADDNEEFGADHESQKKLPSGLNEKRMKHQLFVTSLYNKVIMLHLCPHTGEIFIHELEPNVTFKYNQSISIPRGDVLHQMQVIDNLIVVHNLDQKSTNMFDIKLAEYSQPICVDNLDVDT